MENTVYLNGEWVPAGEAKVGITDSAFLHGVGLFETLRSYNGCVFRLGEHLDRMEKSASELKLPLPAERETLENAVRQVLTENDLLDARLRLTVTRETVLATAAPLTGYPEEFYSRGMTVVFSPYRQSAADPLTGHKTTGFFSRLLALESARQAHAGEAIWLNHEGHLAEGCITNLFLVKSGTLLTPPLDTPVLPGITRAAVIQLASEDGLSVEQRPLAPRELLEADEVFLTNAIMEVMPVCRLADRDLGSGRPGPISTGLLSAYRQLAEL